MTFRVQVSINPAEAGSVSGEGTYNYGDEVAVTVVRNEDWAFQNWTENDEIVSEELTYVFVITSDRNLDANFTYTEDRATQVDFALPYMKVALGVVSPDGALITDVEQLNGKTLIVSKGTTAETFFEQNYPEVKLAKYDSYTEAYIALLDGRGDALSTDNTEVLAWAIENPGFSVGIESLGSLDTINPAVSQGNETLLAWINEEIVKLGEENFFHADYEATLRETYGANADADSLVVEGGVL